MAKDRTPASGNRSTAGKGRTRTAANVVAPQRPWWLIVVAVVVAVFAAAVLTYAVLTVHKANAHGRRLLTCRLLWLRTSSGECSGRT